MFKQKGRKLTVGGEDTKKPKAVMEVQNHQEQLEAGQPQDNVFKREKGMVEREKDTR